MTGYNDKRESEVAPLPFSLSALQIEAAKRFAMSAQQVLDICQRLYETHKLLTYPRSDSRHLPEEHFAGRHAVMAAIATMRRRWPIWRASTSSGVTAAGMTTRLMPTMPSFLRPGQAALR